MQRSFYDLSRTAHQGRICNNDDDAVMKEIWNKIKRSPIDYEKVFAHNTSN